MNTKEQEIIKDALRFIKVARHLEPSLCLMLLTGDLCKKKVIEPLKEVCGWTEEDQATVLAAAHSIEEEAGTRIFDTKRPKRVKKIFKKKRWWIFGTLATATAAYIAGRQLKKKQNTGQ